MEKVIVKDYAQIIASSCSGEEVFVDIKKDQRWYAEQISENVIKIERENVAITMQKDSFENLFKNSMRTSKWE